MEGGGAMTTYEALSLMILFSMLVIAVLNFRIKK
ncbi:putative holin-like toxin [Geosporobacter ferrireducens]